MVNLLSRLFSELRVRGAPRGFICSTVMILVAGILPEDRKGKNRKDLMGKAGFPA